MDSYQHDQKNESQYHLEFQLKNNETLILRTVALEDAQALMTLMKTLDSETRFLVREPEEFNLTLEQEENFIKNIMSNNQSHFFVAEVNKQIIGSCSVGIIMNKSRFLHRAAMGIAIIKEHWHKGIGQIMMAESIRWCQNNNIEQLELDVVADNQRAYKLYENFGFKVYGTKKHALKYSDGTYADEYFMILELKK